MKKNKFFTFTLFFILQIILTTSFPGQFTTKDREIWTQPLKQCWAYQSDKFLQTNIASDNAFIFTPLSNGEIRAIHSKTGEIQWSAELGGEIISNLLSDKNAIYALNEIQITNDNKSTSTPNKINTTEVSLRSIDITSGVVNWNTPIPIQNLKVRALIYGDQIVLISENGNLILINSRDGKILREHKTDGEISSAHIFEDTVVLGTLDKRLIFIKLYDTLSIKELSIPEAASNIFLNGQGRVFWSDRKGTLRTTNTDSGKIIWAKRFGAEISGILGIYDGLLITSLDNFIYLIDRDSGNILWKRRLASRITEKPFIKDDIAVLYAFGDSSALFIELKKGKVINSISLSDANSFVGNPVYIGNLLIFPTLKGLFAFGNECRK